MVRYHNFLITEDGGKLNFKNLKTSEGKNGVRVVYESGYTYKCQKAQIKSVHTAAGLLELFEKAIDENFMTAIIVCVCRAYVGNIDYDYIMEV